MRNVLEGNAPYYSMANNQADHTDIYLAAQNNNYNNNKYIVTGNWDEETGINVYPQW